MSKRDPKKHGVQWAYAPEMKGGHTEGGLEWALSILNYEDPSPQAPDIFLEWALSIQNSAEDRQRLLEMRRELRSLVTEWQACNRNFDKVFRKDRERGVAFQTGWLAYLEPDGVFRIRRDPGTQDTTPRGVARTAFANLIGDPNRNSLGGPCDRCGRYYIKNRPNHKRYCGRSCAHLASATKSTNERLHRDREDKLKRATQRITQWQALKRKPKGGWKKWVARAVPDLSVTFLTRAVNSGDLVPPTDRAKERDYAKG